MPINPALRHFYRTPEYRLAREKIVKRAKNRCERCRVPNGSQIARFRKYPGWWFTLDGDIFDQHGRAQGQWRGSDWPEADYISTIRLTLAHLDHEPGNNALSNLQLLCGRCHFMHDLEHHHETRARRKDAARPLLGANE